MKQVLAYCLFLLFSLSMLAGTACSQSGWVRQTLPPPILNRDLFAVSFADANTGTVVGDSDTILHTTDGGTTWTSQTSGSTNPLLGVSVSDANTESAVGDSGTILHTTNGGKTWIRQSSGTMNTLRGVTFGDFNTGTVIGDSGTILRTTNGGTLWMSQPSGTTYCLNAVSFIDANTGTAVGDSGTILRTTNGGSTWTSQSIVTDYQLYGVSFEDADTGTAVGYYVYAHGGVHLLPGDAEGGIILRTTNSGTTWTIQFDGLYNVWSILPLLGVSFTDAHTGTVVGHQGILRTTSGGDWNNHDNGWSRQSGEGHALYGVCFIDANTGTVVGGYGTILRTTTGGVTAVRNNLAQMPNQFALEQNYPNPFNPTTVIRYTLPRNSLVTVKVYDALGREMQTLVNEHQTEGNQSVTFSASGLPSGVYFYKLQTGSYSAVKRLVLLK
jgi:photosystem II stability/assembly factor-like uncharacterized protein